MLIGELAERSGVSAKTLRFYEERGLLDEPARTAGNYRDYDSAVLGRLRFIGRAQRSGLTLQQIGEILAIRDGGEAPCRHVARSVDDRLAEVEDRLGELERTRQELQALRDRLVRLDVAACAEDRVCSAIDGAGR